MTASDTSRILLVDDHPVFREGLRTLLRQAGIDADFADASTREECLAALAAAPSSLVILDLSLGTDSGLDVLADILNRDPRARVLVLSMHDELLYGERCMQVGARGYVMKGAPPAEIIAAVTCVLNGDVDMSPALAARRSDARTQAWASLTDREWDVVHLMAALEGPKDIARRLKISVKTVEFHQENLRAKLNAKDNRELQRIAVANIKPSGMPPPKA